RLVGGRRETEEEREGSENGGGGGGKDAVNPARTGTKAAAHYQLTVEAGQTAVIRLRLGNAISRDPFGNEFDQIMEARRREANEFYRAVTPAHLGEDATRVMRQALAGMLWGKQHFFCDVDKWLQEPPRDPRLAGTRRG